MVIFHSYVKLPEGRLMGSYWLLRQRSVIRWYVDCSTQSKPFPKKIASRWLHSLFLTQALARWSRKSLRNIKKLNPCRLCSPSNLASEDQRAVWMEDTARACALNGYPWVPQISIAKISVTPKSYLYYQVISSGLYNLYSYKSDMGTLNPSPSIST